MLAAPQGEPRDFKASHRPRRLRPLHLRDLDGPAVGAVGGWAPFTRRLRGAGGGDRGHRLRIPLVRIPAKPVETTFAVANPPRTAIENEEDPQPLVVTFDRPAAPLGTTGKPVSASITMNPALEGTWSWRDDKTLIFTPNGDWPVGEEYSVRLGREYWIPGPRACHRAAARGRTGQSRERSRQARNEWSVPCCCRGSILPGPRTTSPPPR